MSKKKESITAVDDNKPLYGNIQSLGRALKSGADPNAKEDGNFTALICAAARGHVRVVETLLESGANLRAKTKRGRTAADIAIQEGQVEVIHLLRAAEGAV